MSRWKKRRNYLLLLQGQFVSSAGDALYEIALGFFLLQTYRSSALAATVVAVSAVPGLLAAPFAGVVIDRMNQKRILVLADFLRGTSMTVTAAWTCLGRPPLWAFYATGTILSVGGAFFTPCVKSLIPRIVEPDRLMRANSVLNAAQNLTQTVGNSAGGFLYRLGGAGVMFLTNGVSYLFSGFLSLFLKVQNPPEHEKADSEPLSFWKDLKNGIGYTARFTGLKDLILMAFILNFFASGSFFLLQPLFLRTPGFGIQKYGIAAGAISAGNLMGMLFTSVFRIPPRKQMAFFLAAAAADTVLNALFPFAGAGAGLILPGAAGFGNSVVNVLILTAVQRNVSEKMQGKVFSLISMGAHGIAPLGIAAAGAAAEFFNLKFLIFTCNLVNLLCFVFFAFQKPFRGLINSGPETPRRE